MSCMKLLNSIQQCFIGFKNKMKRFKEGRNLKVTDSS